MKPVVLVVATCAALTGCESRRELTTDPIAAPAPTYVLFGTVRDSAGAPLANATAVVTTGKYLGRFALSNESGYFKFIGLTGPLTLRVTKEDYEMTDKPLDVRGDLSIDVVIKKIFFSDSIELGRTIRSNIAASAKPCDPVRWDAQAPCRRFRLTASSPGLLSLQIKWDGLIPLDATIVTLPNDYVATSSDVGFGTVTIAASLTAGVTYEVRINSYYGGLTFDLAATFQP